MYSAGLRFKVIGGESGKSAIMEFYDFDDAMLHALQ